MGLIEGISDGLAAAARLGGGALVDDPNAAERSLSAGYITTAPPARDGIADVHSTLPVLVAEHAGEAECPGQTDSVSVSGVVCDCT